MLSYDAIVIGAGMAGMYQLHLLKKLGLSVRVYEAGGDLGGTWFWNRYPGCRFDSETFSYCFSFSDEILQEWDWTEEFAPQPETLRYLNFIADKLELREDIQFNSRIVGAEWDDNRHKWLVKSENNSVAECTYLVCALGPLSIPHLPQFTDSKKFEGLSFHSSRWPEGLDITGKRVAVIGTGATGVQIIQTIARDVAHLTVYQREGNWTSPLRNKKIPPEDMQQAKKLYPAVFARCRETDACFVHQADPRGTFEVSDEEREAFYEDLYQRPGFASWLGNFRDLYTSVDAAWTYSKFAEKKLRARVRNQAVADILVPKSHPFGAKRVPMETNYYEVYNRDNVELIDIKANPIEKFTENGIVTAGQERSFDIIVFATGFNAFRGGYDHIEFRGVDGDLLFEKWLDGPKTYMGLMGRGFPNMFALLGPHNGGTFCNVPRCIEQNAELITKFISDMRRDHCDRIEPTLEAEQNWTAEGYTRAAAFLPAQFDGWFNSSQANIPGGKKVFLLYAMAQPEFRALCADIIADNYRGFERSGSRVRAHA